MDVGFPTDVKGNNCFHIAEEREKRERKLIYTIRKRGREFSLKICIKRAVNKYYKYLILYYL